MFFFKHRESAAHFSFKGTWCSGITSASHADARVSTPSVSMLVQSFLWSNSGFGQQLPSEKLVKLDLKHVLCQTQRVSNSSSVAGGTWCSGITSALHAERPGLSPQCVHACRELSLEQNRVCSDMANLFFSPALAAQVVPRCSKLGDPCPKATREMNATPRTWPGSLCELAAAAGVCSTD